MKSIFFAILTFIASLAVSTVSAANLGGACTMDYTPVCATVQVQCIRAPCYPIYQTFGNKCGMEQETTAKFAYNGACKQKEEGAPAILSESLKTYLVGRYNRFFISSDDMDGTTPLAQLQMLDNRITERLEKLIKDPSMTLVQEEEIDILKQALLFLQNLAHIDITRIQNQLNGVKYVSHNPQQCNLMDFMCKPDETQFSDDTGCGCK